MKIRKAELRDLDAIAQIEAGCFPAAEAASKESIEKRLRAFPEHFWLLEEEGKIVSFVNGMTTDFPDLTDRMYADASMHDERGDWQMIFGVDTLPEYRCRGCAGKLLRTAIEDARRAGRKGVVLTCKEKLLHYYARFGFRDEGVCDSTHGGAVWHQMRITFAEE